MGLKLFGVQEVRSNTVISVAYPDGIKDKDFRSSLETQYGVVVAGGFGDYAGKLFRVGSLGMVNQYHVLTTISAIGNNLRRLGFNANLDSALDAAMKNLTNIRSKL